MGFWDNLKKGIFKEQKDVYLEGLGRSRNSFASKLRGLSLSFKGLDEDFLEELMVILLEADVGIHTANKILAQFEKNSGKYGKDFNSQIECLIEVMAKMYGENETLTPTYPKVILLVGVNGNGKTTTAAKLANNFKKEGKSLVLGAADTFRAGAMEQLQMWADRLDVPCVKGKENGDPSSVLVDACRYMKEHEIEVLIGDTAGRLQNKVNLMNELNKMKRVVSREIEGAPHDVLLVLDATTGQNGIEQARVFLESAAVNGIVLTKMDGTAKGGVVLAIKDQLGIPVKYIGFGESMEDLRPFDINAYLVGLFEGVLQ
ncbi:MAG: signal recognition particle-docking protein FtsY [Erysipelotrichaceae bacterium]|nr:signal recognition particle-docking protein FtsY [Erysipelotrichaceae bacterium]